MAFDLKRILQALLFSSSEALSIKDIQGVITRYHQQETAPADEETEGGENGAEPTNEIPSLVTATQIREAMTAIGGELDGTDQVFQLIEGHNGYRLVVRSEFAGWVRCLRGEPKPARLSQAALETLAIIAYRQPTTRAEIESIRGVSADGALNRLLERELVEVQGRAELPGRPIQYGVTEKFLEFVGVKSLDELPASDVLSPRQIDEWIQRAANPTPLSDSEMGLSEE
jgi:segregation and condensation protein B